MRIRYDFLYVDSKFDLRGCKYAWKNNSLNLSLRFRLFLWRTQKQFSVIIS